MSSDATMHTLTGLAIARGGAIGPAFIYRGDGEIPIPQYVVEPGREIDELQRLQRAILETRNDLDKLIAQLRENGSGEDVRVFECHQMLLEDPLLIDEVEKYIREDRINVETAVRRTTRHIRAQFEKMSDPYFRERVRDLDDVERRLQRALTGIAEDPVTELRVPSIIVADELRPSETVRLPRDLVLGFATNGGSVTSHVALLARAMGIPAVAGLGDIVRETVAGETLILDGDAGTVTVFPTEQALRGFEAHLRRQAVAAAPVPSTAPAGTLKDGSVVALYANVHPGIAVDDLKAKGAHGIGLYRSEYLWLNHEFAPTEEEQFAAYREAAGFSQILGGDAPVAIRTIDLGGDKFVSGAKATEPNPFLGSRSIRYCLAHPEILQTQLRAILRASAFGRLAVMFPMISCVEELTAAKRIFAEARTELEARGVAYDAKLPVGMMIEVPAAALNAETFAKQVDFFSIGTNDLIQYTLAADRGNEAVANLYQPTHPAVLQLMRLTIAAAKKRGIPVGVCGESAADPVLGPLWLALGVDALSMSASYIPAMAKVLRGLTRADLDAYAKKVEDLGTDLPAAEVYAACRACL